MMNKPFEQNTVSRNDLIVQVPTTIPDLTNIRKVAKNTYYGLSLDEEGRVWS
jgi:hypothetical protein